MYQYSTLFSCLYNEYRPEGTLGRGTHHAVFRAPLWFDWQGRKYDAFRVHDFAILWDENEDARIIQFLEQVYAQGLLSPLRFVGKRNNVLTAVSSAGPSAEGNDENEAMAYHNALDAVATAMKQPFEVRAANFDRERGELGQSSTSIFYDARDERLSKYLAEIDTKWQLGTKPYEKSARSN